MNKFEIFEYKKLRDIPDPKDRIYINLGNSHDENKSNYSVHCR